MGISVIAGMVFLVFFLLALCGPFAISGIISVGFIYAVQQWILGWPDRYLLLHEVTLASNQNKPHQVDPLIGRIARVVTPLRLSGKIVIDEEEFDAASEFGFIDTGIEVEIINKKGFNFIVRPITDKAEQCV